MFQRLSVDSTYQLQKRVVASLLFFVKLEIAYAIPALN